MQQQQLLQQYPAAPAAAASATAAAAAAAAEAEAFNQGSHFFIPQTLSNTPLIGKVCPSPLLFIVSYTFSAPCMHINIKQGTPAFDFNREGLSIPLTIYSVLYFQCALYAYEH